MWSDAMEYITSHFPAEYNKVHIGPDKINELSKLQYIDSRNLGPFSDYSFLEDVQVILLSLQDATYMLPDIAVSAYPTHTVIFPIDTCNITTLKLNRYFTIMNYEDMFIVAKHRHKKGWTP